MGRKIRSWAELESALQKEMYAAMSEAVENGYLKACENIVDFYSEGKPVFYERTGTYGDAPDTDGVQGNGNHLSAKIYMNPSGHGYSTGTFSAQEVWQAAEDHTCGVLGKPGRWEQAEKDIESAMKDAFTKRFHGK